MWRRPEVQNIIWKYYNSGLVFNEKVIRAYRGQPLFFSTILDFEDSITT